MKISVIIPCYNSETYMDKCIESVINQTLKDIEIILVDDGSKDRTRNKMLEYKEKYKGIKLILLEENSGLGNARNIALNEVSGKYLFYIDSDDYVELDTLEKCYNKLEKTGADIVQFEYFKQYNNKKYRTKIKKCYDINECIVNIEVVAWNKLIKTSLIKDTKSEFAVGLQYEDILFTYSYVPYINKIEYICEPLYHYVQRKNSISNNQDSRVSDVYKVLIQLYDVYKNRKLFKNYIDEIEYLYIRTILGTSYKRASKIREKEIRKKILEEGWKLLNDKFPNWKKNKYLKKNTLMHIYFKNLNYFLYKRFYVFFKL